MLLSRKRLNCNWDIPYSVVNIVHSICVDYDRRAQIISHAEAPLSSVESQYIQLNQAVDQALAGVEIAIRRTMLDDIQKRRGYDFSPASPFISKNTYYMRKRKIIHDIAKLLNLIA